jgi:hypothetical protein
MLRHILACTLFLAAIVGCQAQSSADVYVQSTTYPGEWGWLSTHFVGVKLSTGGSAVVNFYGGDDAWCMFVLSYSDHYQGAAFCPTDHQYVTITQTGTYWIYLAEEYSTVNYDWIEIRVVANSFSGTISPLYGSAPSGWSSFGWPPYGVHMTIGHDGAAIPPPSQPGPTNYKKWLIPLLVLVIVAAIAIPSTVYLVRRHKAKKLAALAASASTATTPEMEQQQDQHAVQMTPVHV